MSVTNGQKHGSHASLSDIDAELLQHYPPTAMVMSGL